MAGESMNNRSMTFEKGWPFLKANGIDRVIDGIEGVGELRFTAEEYLALYTTAYEINYAKKDPGSAGKLYDQYKKTFEDYISSKVLPSLREKTGESLLQELVKRWNTHKVMASSITKFLSILNRYFVRGRKLPTLLTTSHLIFYELVYGELNDKVKDSAISMIAQEREGEKIDQTLLKNVLDIYVEMGEGSMKYYEDFEEAMLKTAAEFYSQKASIWITNDTYKDYMLKAEECLKQEKEGSSHYLQSTSQNKLLEHWPRKVVAEHELLSVHSTKLQEMKTADSVSA